MHIRCRFTHLQFHVGDGAIAADHHLGTDRDHLVERGHAFRPDSWAKHGYSHRLAILFRFHLKPAHQGFHCRIKRHLDITVNLDAEIRCFIATVHDLDPMVAGHQVYPANILFFPVHLGLKIFIAPYPFDNLRIQVQHSEIRLQFHMQAGDFFVQINACIQVHVPRRMEPERMLILHQLQTAGGLIAIGQRRTVHAEPGSERFARHVQHKPLFLGAYPHRHVVDSCPIKRIQREKQI